MTSALLALILASAPTYAAPTVGPGWTSANTAAEVVFGATLLADYCQTRKIAAQGKETNPVIGPHGGRVTPGIYFPATFALHVLITRVLPEPWRSVFQVVSIGFEAGVVGRNVGLGFSFP